MDISNAISTSAIPPAPSVPTIGGVSAAVINVPQPTEHQGQDEATFVGFSDSPTNLNQRVENRHTNSLLRYFSLTVGSAIVLNAREIWAKIKETLLLFINKCFRLSRLDKVLGLWKLLTNHPFVRQALSPYVWAGVIAGAAYMYRKSGDKNQTGKKAKRVAIIGSGIAGTGAAWSLHKAGIDVVLYEKKPTLGGNAKNFTWDVDGKKVKTSLAVFAWPEKLFHSYGCLVNEMEMETEDHDLRFFVSERLPNGEQKCVFAHNREGWKPEPWLQEDLAKWSKLCSFVKGVNAVVQPASDPSLYRMSYFNPLNVIPLRTLCRFFSISDRFWDFVFVPIHTSTFLEVEMGTVPAVLAELLDDIVPFNEVPRMKTWKSNANDIIDRMTADFPAGSCRTSCGVEKVEYIPKFGTADAPFDIKVHDEDGNIETFDGVIFACSAVAMNQILHGKLSGSAAKMPGQFALPNDRNGLNNPEAPWYRRALNWMEELVFTKTMYTVDRDKTFEKGTVHSCGSAVIPSQFEKEVLEDYCNYIEVDTSKPQNLENTFVISSWAPTAQAPDVKGKLPMLVTYNAEKKLENEDTLWTVTSREAHPCLTTWQMMASSVLWPMLQGTRKQQTYFCGSAVTPGNGHDLSFLSGLVAASQLGAPFPFSYNPKAQADFERLRFMMFSFWQ